MEAKQREVLYYLTADGVAPFERWFFGLRDAKARAQVLTRIARAGFGNFGDHAAVGEGVCELRIDFGPGYRVYYGIDGDGIVMLGGGDKSTQAGDIESAKVRWRDYKESDA